VQGLLAQWEFPVQMAGTISVHFFSITIFQDPKKSIMAEIHVQTKKNTGNSTWIWVVLAIIVIGAVVYYLMNRNKAATTTTPPANSTSAVRYFAGRQADDKIWHAGKRVQIRNNIVQQKALLS
jgi:hypothetical protein